MRCGAFFTIKNAMTVRYVEKILKAKKQEE